MNFYDDTPSATSATAAYSDDADDSNSDNWDDDEYEDDSDQENDRRPSGMNGTKDGTEEMREQMYRDKLADLKRQLLQLEEKALPEYVKRIRKLEGQYKERIRVNEIIRALEVEMVEKDFINEKKSAAREFEDQKVFLRENLISELEEKQKMIESERHNELTSDPMEMKQVTTRKLRRRANDTSNAGGYGNGEKRRKPMQMSSLSYTLDDCEILDDLKIINKNKAVSLRGTGTYFVPHQSNGTGSHDLDAKIEDGKLWYNKKWFRRGQSVYVEPKAADNYPAVIATIATEAVWVRKTGDHSKAKIYLTQLVKGKIVLKKRAA